MSPDQLRDTARTSNKVLHDMVPDIQWALSYVAGDKKRPVLLAERWLDGGQRLGEQGAHAN